MRKFKTTFRKLEDAWRLTNNKIELKYPIFHYDKAIPDDPTIKMTITEVIGDVDFWGWEGNKEDRIVDSSGKVFITKFEKKKGYSLFIIPTEFRSGMFPGELERNMDIDEVKKIMISGIDRNIGRIKENIDELKTKIDSTGSIENILKICDQFF